MPIVKAGSSWMWMYCMDLDACILWSTKLGPLFGACVFAITRQHTWPPAWRRAAAETFQAARQCRGLWQVPLDLLQEGRPPSPALTGEWHLRHRC